MVSIFIGFGISAPALTDITVKCSEQTFRINHLMTFIRLRDQTSTFHGLHVNGKAFLYRYELSDTFLLNYRKLDTTVEPF